MLEPQTITQFLSQHAMWLVVSGGSLGPHESTIFFSTTHNSPRGEL